MIGYQKKMEPITDESDVQSMYSMFYAYVCVDIKDYRKVAIASKKEFGRGVLWVCEREANRARTMTEEGEENAPIFLSFNDLGVKINDRQILQNVSGKVHPGEMLAVMGPSGKLRTFKNTFLPFNRIKWPVNWKVIISRSSNLYIIFYGSFSTEI